MKKLLRIWRRLIFYLRREEFDRELEEEMEVHLALKVEEKLAAGMNERAARDEARREFGNQTRLREASREVWAFNPVEALVQDLRYGARMLGRAPGFTAAAVITLALGIGVNTAVFTVFDAFALRPLPLKDPEGLVNIYGLDPQGVRLNLFSYPDYLDYRDRNSVFSGLVALNGLAAAVGDLPLGPDEDSLSGDSKYVLVRIVSGNYFSVLGAEMAQGRSFLPEEDRTPGTHPVIVLGHWFWQRHFNSDPQVLGKMLKLHGQPFTVIGVTARDFIGTSPDAPAGWIPLMMREQLIPTGWWNHRRWLTDRGADAFNMIGRLRPGVSREQAEAEMRLIARRLAESYPGKDRKVGVTLRSGMTFVSLSAEELPLIAPLLAAVGLVLLICCANVANLLLARAATRQREIGVRLALGASRGRLIRQLLTESILISVLGGAAGLLLAIWTLQALYPVVLSSVPIPAGMKDSFALNLAPDYRIFGFTLLLALAAGIAAGLVPAWQSSRPDLTTALKDEGSTLGRRVGQSRLRNILVAAQIAVCLMLLIGAGLLVRNLRKLQTIDTGLETKNVFTVAASLRATEKNRRDENEVRRRLATAVGALPGVKSVSQAYRQPLIGALRSTPITIPGREAPDGRPLTANYNFVSPGYFETLGIRLTRGRAFTQQEADSGAPMVVISEATARRYWPEENPIGKHLGIGAASTGEPTGGAAAAFPQFEIIGVVRDTRSGWVWRKDETYLYVPLRPDNRLGDYLVVRAEGDLRAVMAAARGAAEAFGDLRVTVRRVEDSLEYQMLPFRAMALLAGVLGLLALLLAAVGLYGVMAYAVNQQTHEIGVRLALGARQSDVLRLILGQGLRLTAAGIACGVAGGAAVSRMLAAALVDLSPFDPVTFGGVPLFLALVAMLATYLPARRAMRLDPMAALRCA